MAYCFDFYGGCKGSKSGGSMLEMSIFTERDDLSAVIGHVKTLDVVDQENLFLLGESQGGCVAGITDSRFSIKNSKSDPTSDKKDAGL